MQLCISLQGNFMAANRFRVRNHCSRMCICVHAHTEEHKTTGIFLKSQEYHWNNNVQETMHLYCKFRGRSLLSTQKTARWTKWLQGYLHPWKKTLLYRQIQASISWTSQTVDEGFLIENSGSNQPPTDWLKICSRPITYGSLWSTYLQMRVRMSDRPGKERLGRWVSWQQLRV